MHGTVSSKMANLVHCLVRQPTHSNKLAVHQNKALTRQTQRETFNIYIILVQVNFQVNQYVPYTKASCALLLKLSLKVKANVNFYLLTTSIYYHSLYILLILLTPFLRRVKHAFNNSQI